MRPVEPLDNLELAIIGMSGRFPRAANLEQFWQNLQNGIDCISSFSHQELLQRGVDQRLLMQNNYVRAAPVLEDSDLFAASFFGYSPREAELMDPQHRLLLECAWEALEVAGYDVETFPGLIGVYGSTSLSTYLLFNLLANPSAVADQDTFQVMLGNDKDFLSTRLSYTMNLRGPSLDVQTGCSSSLVALHLACESLLSFQTDMALVGGVSVAVPQRTGYMYQPGGITSPDGHCRPFDAQARGTVFGSGVGVVVLKRLAEALRDRDTIHAVIKGSAINNDGASKVGYTAPSVEGQAEVITRAQVLANVEAETISYVEAHGTGTALGDPIEVEALTRAFRRQTQACQFCALGSVKGNIGHLDAAAGIAGLLKTVLALKHAQLPPSLHYQQANPAIDFASSPFAVNSTLRPWPRGNTPRRAGVSSFGIGGTNAHVIVEEAPARQPSGTSRPCHLLLYSARSAPALERQREQLRGYLAESEEPLADVAYTLQVGRKAFGWREAVLCRDRAQGQERLAGAASERLDGSRGGGEPRERRVAWLFPGQGAQYVQMGRELYEQEAAFRREVDAGAEQVQALGGPDLRAVLYPRAQDEEAAREQLRQTRLAQPALFVVSYALAQLLLDWGLEPDAMIGHSVGEYVAASLAGVLRVEDALRLLVERAELMQRQPEGGMLAVSLSEEEAQEVARRAGVWVAAVNGPSSCVLAGGWAGLGRAEERINQQGRMCRRLETSHAFHSGMMEAVVAPLTEAARRVSLQEPRRRYLSTVSGDWIREEQARDAEYWGRQVREPVRFAAAVERLREEGEWVCVEVGPGTGLSTQVSRQMGRAGIALLGGRGREQSEVEGVLEGVGKVWVQGGTVQWERYWRGEERRRVELPTYPFERQRFWISPQHHALNSVSATATTERGGQANDDVKSSPDEWLYMPVWKRALTTTIAPGSADAHHWLVFTQDNILCNELIAHLRRKKQEVIVVEAGTPFAETGRLRYRVNPSSLEDYIALLQRISAQSLQISRVVHLWPLALEQSAQTLMEFENASACGFYSLLNLAKAFSHVKYKEQVSIWVVTNHLYNVSGVELTDPFVAPVQAFASVLAQEFSHLRCRCIDIEASSELDEKTVVSEQVALIWREMQNTSSEAQVAYRHNQRWVQGFEPLHLAQRAVVPPWRPGGSYLIVGGLGTIGFAVARHLAETVKGKLAIIGSTCLPPRQEWSQILASTDADTRLVAKLQRLLALEELGSQVLYVCADVTDGEALQESFTTIRTQFQELHGVIYAAGNTGVQTIKLIADITQTDCEDQFRVKVRGLYHLAHLLRDWALDFCLVFSSNAALLGGIGSIAYTGAHLFVDAFALHQAKQSKTPWLTVNWDGWLAASETDTTTPLRTSLDQYRISSREGIDILQFVLAQIRGGQVIVSRGELEPRISFWLKSAFHGERTPLATTSYVRPELATAYVPPNSQLEEQLIALWQELLGIGQIGIHDNFFDLGGNSLIGLNLIARLNETFKVDLPVLTLFEKPTISSLAKVIDQGHVSDENSTYERVQKRAERRKERREQRSRL